MPRKIQKPKTPAEILAEKNKARSRDFERVGLNPEAAYLETNADIEITREGDDHGSQRAGQDIAKRVDVFESLRAKMPPGAYDAAVKLEENILKSRGEHDRGRIMFRVDGQEPEGGRLDDMLAAGDEVKRALSFVGDRDRWLLMELIIPTLECSLNGGSFKTYDVKRDKDGREISRTLKAEFHGWRATVALITGEENIHCQGAAVRSACANLAQAYETRTKAA